MKSANLKRAAELLEHKNEIMGLIERSKLHPGETIKATFISFISGSMSVSVDTSEMIIMFKNKFKKINDELQSLGVDVED